MKKALKWIAIIFASLILIVVCVVAGVFIAHDRYGFYPTGGELSELQAQYDAVYYDLNLEINSKKQALAGYADVTVKSLVDTLSAVELDLINNFDVSKVLLAGEDASFRHKKQKLVVIVDPAAQKGQLLTLRIHYSGQPIQAIRPPWIGGFNWSKDSLDNDWIGVSCQGEGGKIWFPCKSHPSDEPDSAAINITVPEPYYCASNGVLEGITKPRPGFQTFHWKTRYPINNYNISINIAKYKILEKSYTSIDGNRIPVVYYHLADSTRADTLVNMAIDMLQTLEKYFGEYPFAREKFGLAETAYLGMEHQTINSYGNGYKWTTRDGFDFDWLMLHEMSHEWWGNKVTVADWADFWIHEGIGTYTEALYLLDKIGEKAYHQHMAGKRSAISNETPIMPQRPALSNKAYTRDIYYKGAYFMHSLRYILGDSLLFPILHEFATDSATTYKNQVTTADFLDLVNKRSARDLSPFFHFYLETTDLLAIVIDSLDAAQWDVSIPNIDFQLPVEVEVDGERQRLTLSSSPTRITADSIAIDPQKWYLHKNDFVD